MNNTKTFKDLISGDLTRNKFAEVLGKNAQGFITSLMGIVNNSKLLSECDPQTILSAAMTAAILELPINPNLGFSYIIPYKNKNKVLVAQFQIGYKGFIQLSQRSGQFKSINVSDVRKTELVGQNRESGVMMFNWLNDEEREKLPIIGYIANFNLLNGFSKSEYRSVEQLKNHGLKYSASYRKDKSGLWADNFDAMAKKTVLKLLLSKYAPMSTHMQIAIESDQAVINGEKMEYVDNPIDNQIENHKTKALEGGKELSLLQIEKINETKDIKELINICKKIKEEDISYAKSLIREYTRRKSEIEQIKTQELIDEIDAGLQGIS